MRPSRFSLKDDVIILKIKEIIKERTTYGYRRVTALLNKAYAPEEIRVNHKRVYRIMKTSELLLPKKSPRRIMAHDGKIATLKSNTRWCSDSFSIQCWNGDKVHVAFSLDTHDREAMRYIASTIGVDGQMIRDLITESVEYRFGQLKLPHKIQWLSDNGPCYTSHDTVNFARLIGFEVCTTPAYSPESNGMAEAFVKTFKRDYTWQAELRDAKTVMAQLGAWFKDYNENAPHKALKMKSPRQFIQENVLTA
jgi:transposase InsO family protein